MDYPELTLDIIKKIVKDGVELFPSINKVGLIGSYARNEQNKTSDVDLMVDVDDTEFNDMLNVFGNFAYYILDYQFNKKLEIVRYNLAVECAAKNPDKNEFWYYKNGYRQMLKEVKWLYERQNYIDES